MGMRKTEEKVMNKTFNSLHTPVIPFEYNEKIINKATDARIYRDVTLLAPGSWADSITLSPVIYPEEVLKRCATNWEENYLNLDHSYHVLDRVGYIQNPHFADHKVKADLYIFPITKNARDVIALIDKGLINWLSVEIKTEDGWDAKDNARYVKDMTFIGAAIVTTPACKDALIREDGPKFNRI